VLYKAVLDCKRTVAIRNHGNTNSTGVENSSPDFGLLRSPVKIRESKGVNFQVQPWS